MADKGVVAELFTEESFWDKLGKHAILAGPKLVRDALVLYYTWKKPATPNRIKAAIMGALAYFVMPLDAIPDTILGIGYLDDLGVLAWHTIRFPIISTMLRSRTRRKRGENGSARTAPPPSTLCPSAVSGSAAGGFAQSRGRGD